MKNKSTLKNWLSTILLTYAFSMSFSQTTYFVDVSRSDNAGAGTNWATAKRDVQAAIQLAVAGDEIWVRQGTYLPTHDPLGNVTPADNRDKTFTLKEGVKIYGGFLGNETLLNQRDWKNNLTVLSGDLGVANTRADNAYHVVVSVNLSSASALDGFIIANGYATAPWQSSITVGSRVLYRYRGGGIYNINANTSFSNCTISNNSADCTDTNDDAWGAGVNNEFSSSSFTNCIIDSNSFLTGGNSFGVFGAGMIITGGACTISNTIFSNNSGGSGFFDASRGGALYIVGTNTTTITNSIFYNNNADNGAGIGCGGADSNLFQVVNSVFVNNTSRFAGVAYTGFSKATFKNTIFWNNPPTSSGASGRDEIFSQDSRVGFQPTFVNCIIRDATGSPLTITNAVVTNSLNTNPLFVNQSDADGSDNTWGTSDDGLALQSASPAKNTGISDSSIPVLDFLGNPRDSQPDMGPYEFQEPCVNPTAYNVTGGGSYCSGESGATVGLSNSEIGVTYQLKVDSVDSGSPVSGTGASISFGNQTTVGNYTVEATRTTGGCSSFMNGSVSVTITTVDAPTGESVQSLSASTAPEVTLADIVIDNPINLSWFGSNSDAINNANTLPETTELVNGSTYYAVNTQNGCRSTPFAVTVNVTLGLNNAELDAIKIYPNPTNGKLFITSHELITQVEVINVLGQSLATHLFNTRSLELDMSSFGKGIYILKISSGISQKTIRVLNN